MKIKCPGCAAVLNIPETAAGKVVQCQCGKKLKAPGGPATGTAASGAAQPTKPVSPRPRPPAARPQASAANIGGLDAGLFDELSENDLQGVAPVHRPGSAPKTSPSAGGKMMQDYGPPGASGKRTTGGRPGLLIAVGVVNALYVGMLLLICLFLTLLFFGAISSQSAIKERLTPEQAEALTNALGIVALIAWVVWVWSVIVCACCFIQKKACWYILLLSYPFTVVAYIFALGRDLLYDLNIVRVITTMIAICISSSIWFYLHQKRPREFYGTATIKTSTIIAINVVGALLGLIAGLPLVL